MSPSTAVVISTQLPTEHSLFHAHVAHSRRQKFCSRRTARVYVLLAYIGTGQVMGWGHKAIEIRSVDNGELDGVFMHKKPQKLKFLCERNDKVRVL